MTQDRQAALEALVPAAGDMITAIMMMQQEGFEVPFGLIDAARKLQDAYLAAGGGR